MPTATLIQFEGIDEVCRMLSSAPRLIIQRAWFECLQAAAGVLRDALEQSTPYTGNSMGGTTARSGFGNFAHAGRGALRENLVTDIELDSKSRGGVAEVGYGKLGNIANWVEYGHRMVGPRPGLKDTGKFVPAHPFMRPAFERSADAAMNAFAVRLRQILSSNSIPNLPTSGGTT